MQSYHYDTAPTPTKGKEPATASLSQSSQPISYKRRRPLSPSTFVRPQTTQAVPATSRSLGTLDVPVTRRSNTWTSSSGDIGLLSGGDEVEDRQEFVGEYNRLAKRVTYFFNSICDKLTNHETLVRYPTVRARRLPSNGFYARPKGKLVLQNSPTNIVREIDPNCNSQV